MKIMQIMGGIVAIALGVAMIAPQAFLWGNLLVRPKLTPGQLPLTNYGLCMKRLTARTDMSA